MFFAEKLSNLLSITHTSNSDLAKAVYLDPSQISRMKTGMRGRPKNSEVIRDIAEFFTLHCTTDSMRSSIYNLTADSRFLAIPDKESFKEILYEWIINDSDDQPSNAIGQFLQKVDRFSVLEADKDVTSKLTVSSHEEDSFTAYSNNTGKRQAILKFFDCLLKKKKIETLYLFTDERQDWLYEDSSFTMNINESIQTLAMHGCQIYRVIPPENNLSYSLGNIERWLPVYMMGNTHEFHYPHPRDDLHRRTIFAAPGHAAVFSRSLAHQTHSHLTMFSSNTNMVDLCYHELLDIIDMCKPIMRAYSTDTAAELYSLRAEHESFKEDAIYRAQYLSLSTLPCKILENISMHHPSSLAKMMIESDYKCIFSFDVLIKEKRFNDIISLPSCQDVLDGKIPIPGTQILPDGPIHYTPEEFILHLQKTIDLLYKYNNYNIYFADDLELKDIIIYCKGNKQLLLIKSHTPFTVFVIDEQSFAACFYEYFRQIISRRSSRITRDILITRLEDMIEKIKDARQTE